MPTGYTSDIYEGKHVTFTQFVLKCARAFDFLSEMRDQPMDDPIPDVLTGNVKYCADAMHAAQQRVTEVQRWSDKEASAEAERVYAEQVIEADRADADTRALMERYNSMLHHVVSWDPPTDAHDNLKSFMITQLQSSSRADCHTAGKPELLSGSAYRYQELRSALRELELMSKHYAEELQRAAESTAWLTALRNSLPEDGE